MPSDQLQFAAEQSGKTQEQILLEYLQARPDQWIPMPELVRVCGGYAVHSRISGLRKAGHDIRNATRSGAGNRKMSSYMLVVNGEEAK